MRAGVVYKLVLCTGWCLVSAGVVRALVLHPGRCCIRASVVCGLVLHPPGCVVHSRCCMPTGGLCTRVNYARARCIRA